MTERARKEEIKMKCGIPIIKEVVDGSGSERAS
jgi:hypothetical protein